MRLGSNTDENRRGRYHDLQRALCAKGDTSVPREASIELAKLIEVYLENLLRALGSLLPQCDTFYVGARRAGLVQDEHCSLVCNQRAMGKQSGCHGHKM